MIGVILAILMAIAAQVFDVWTTNRNLRAGGAEYNPALRWSIATFGSVWPVKVILVLVVVFTWGISVDAGFLVTQLFAMYGWAAGWMNIRHWSA